MSLLLPVEYRLVLAADFYSPGDTDTDWVTTNIGMLDGIASGVDLQLIMNRSGQLTFDVPAEDPRVCALWDDGDPMVSCGNRAVKVWRRVGDIGPWSLIYGGRIWSLEDSGDGDTVSTRVTCFDPLKILEKRVCRDKHGCYFPNLETDPAKQPVRPNDGSVPFYLPLASGGSALQALDEGDWDGSYSSHDIGDSGEHGASFIIKSLIYRTIKFAGGNPGLPFTGAGHCHIELDAEDSSHIWAATAPLEIEFDQQTIAQAIQTLTGMLNVELSIEYIDKFDGVFIRLGGGPRLGSDKPDVILAYATEPNTTSAFSRTVSLDNMGNYFDLSGKKQAGYNHIEQDLTSQQKFLTFEQVENISGVESKKGLTALAKERLAMQKDPRNLVSVVPMPDLSPLPFDDYYLGDTITVEAGEGDYPVTREVIEGLQRVYGIHIVVDDDYGEVVQELIVSPQTGLV